MLVVNLVSWEGVRFSAAPGDIIELPDEVAKARIAAGLCAPAPADKSKAAMPAKSAKPSA
jgi:hypothetical protein